MANPEHLKILQKSIETWNRWRKAHPEVQPDLQGADLRKEGFYRADLHGVNLAGADLSGGHFYEAHLGGADLRGANLTKANLCRTYFQEANLEGANLEQADLKGSLLKGANLTGARFTGAVLREAQLDEVQGLDDKTRLVWEIMNQGAEGRDLRGVDLSRSFLYKANLKGADLGGANLQGATLASADLAGANLLGANLEDANLEKANLRGACRAALQKAVRITLEDALDVSGTVRPAAYVCMIFCSLPASWLYPEGLRPYARERVLKQHYGTNWKAGNADGSRYVIRRFEAQVLGSLYVLRRVRQSVDERDVTVRYWFYLVDQQAQFKRVDAEAFFEESRGHLIEQERASSRGEDPADQQWRTLIAQYGPPQSLSSLTPEEQREAVQERRVLGMTGIRDGYGGGTVGCWLVELKDLGAEASRDPSWYTAYFVFSRPCTLTAEVLRRLKSNGWEDLHELLYL